MPRGCERRGSGRAPRTGGRRATRGRRRWRGSGPRPGGALAGGPWGEQGRGGRMGRRGGRAVAVGGGAIPMQLSPLVPVLLCLGDPHAHLQHELRRVPHLPHAGGAVQHRHLRGSQTHKCSCACALNSTHSLTTASLSPPARLVAVVVGCQDAHEVGLHGGLKRVGAAAGVLEGLGEVLGAAGRRGDRQCERCRCISAAAC